jgi:uncharacterized repeat protein (TIGR03987 family)
MLGSAIIFITLALVFYSVGVWAEKIKGILKKWHMVVFWVGFICDTVGTSIMGQIAKSTASTVQSGLNFHAITGMSAILLMLFHAVWATIVIARKDEKLMKSFHKFSIIVWLIWLIPYISGMIMGMKH